jgi:hypothetical protein
MGKKKKRSTRLKDDAELLVELATLDEVEAVIPTATDHDLGAVPPWCELLLTIKRVDDGSLTPAWPINTRLPLRRHDGELIGQVLHDVLHPDSDLRLGAVGNIWWELDLVVDRIQARVERGREPMKKDVGIALGLAVALAYLIDPREVDVDEVRATAMTRYESRRPAHD